MARIKIRGGNTATFGPMRVELVPVLSDQNEDLLRIQEIRHLVSKIVLLGKKRGRPSKEIEEEENAA